MKAFVVLDVTRSRIVSLVTASRSEGVQLAKCASSFEEQDKYARWKSDPSGCWYLLPIGMKSEIW